VNPKRRGKSDVDPKGEADHDDAKDENHEHGWPIAGIMLSQIEPARFTGVAYFEQALK
jgi:hypothetical protein